MRMLNLGLTATGRYLAAIKKECSFIRIADEEFTPFYDLGDLYGLASLW